MKLTREVLLLFLCFLPLIAFSQQPVSDEYLQSRKEEAHKEMKIQLRQYFGEDTKDGDIFQAIVPRVPEWIIESMQKQISKFDTLKHYSQEEIAKAEYTLGCYYHEQKIKDVSTFKWFMRAAQFGHRDAQFNVGLIYEYGSHNHRRDISQALKWYEKAAEQGSAEAMLNLGTLYYNGKYVKEDFQKGFDYLHSSAEKGNVDAMVGLATIYDEGICIPRDVEKAIAYWLQIVEKSNYPYYGIIGSKYLKGDGVKRNRKKAIQYLIQGCKLGEINATCLLAHCYFSGNGVRKDYTRAFRLVRNIPEDEVLETKCFTAEELAKLQRKAKIK